MTSVYDQLVMMLSAGIGQGRMYFADHPKVLASSEAFVRQLREALRASERESFFLGIADGKLVHDGRYLIGSTIVGRKLVTFADLLRCGGFLFSVDTEPRDVGILFALAAEVTDPLADVTEARALLAARGGRHIELSPPYQDAGWFGQFLFKGREIGGEESADPDQLGSILRAYQSLFSAVDTANERARDDRAIDVDAARTVSEQMLRACQGEYMDVMQLVRYPDYDSYTVGHSVRVAMILVLVGQHLGLEPEFLSELGTAGLLHDIGKAKIPEEILYKPSGLDSAERRVIEGHPAAGALILLENPDAGPLAIAAAWGHHLRHDGRGYPTPPPWVARSLVTELLHVSDVFEALTAVRPYKPALTPRRAFEIMVADRGQFDPRVLARFVAAVGLYPPGSRVLLSNGGQGVVVAAGNDMERPSVRLTVDPARQPIPAADQVAIDLGDPAQADLSVTRLLIENPAAKPAPEPAVS
jgi:HD-GYP domain-containing protein (c-di-GMP phosphodiesterase class II)